MSLYDEFLTVIAEAVKVLEGQKERIKDSLATNRRLEKEFEHHVLLTLIGASKGSGFSFCAMDSEHAFPDIIAEHTSGKCFGVEVKTSKGWATNGNSIRASISDKRIEDIVIVFCKTKEPIEISFKSYEYAISGIQVTHSPRYILNMNMNKKGILEDLGLPYHEFKNLDISKKVKLIRDWYIKNKRDKGKWWIY